MLSLGAAISAFSLMTVGHWTRAEALSRRQYERAHRASVTLLVEGQIAGSGAFVDPSGLILTASHIVSRPNLALAVLTDQGRRSPARLVAVDKGHDLALLKAHCEGVFEWPCLRVASKIPRVGAWVFMVGAPLQRQGLLLAGLVSGSHVEYEYVEECEGYVAVRHLAAMVPKGSSGGTWINREGEIVGVQSGWLNSVGKTDDNSGIAFSADTEGLQTFLAAGRDASTACLGGIVEELWTQAPGFVSRFPEGAEGVAVHQATPGGALDRAGVGRESLIVAIDGKAVRYRRELLGEVRRREPGTSVTLTVGLPDGGKTTDRKVTLDSLEKIWREKR